MKKYISLNKYIETPDIALNNRCLDAYSRVISIIMMHTQTDPVTAREIIVKTGGDLSDAEIRHIVLYARVVDKEPIASTTKGYFKASSYDDYLATASHFYSRIDKMLFGLVTLKEHFRKDNEPNLFGE